MVREIYRIHPSSEAAEVDDYGVWNGSGLETDGLNIWERRADLRGHQFR